MHRKVLSAKLFGRRIRGGYEMGEIRVEKYGILFPELTKEMYEKQRNLYDLLMISLRLKHIGESDAYVYRTSKPSRDGTVIKFKIAKTPEEREEEFLKIAIDYQFLKK